MISSNLKAEPHVALPLQENLRFCHAVRIHSVWHVLRFFTYQLKACCRHITVFRTCSVSVGGKHTFD